MWRCISRLKLITDGLLFAIGANPSLTGLWLRGAQNSKPGMGLKKDFSDRLNYSILLVLCFHMPLGCMWFGKVVGHGVEGRVWWLMMERKSA